MENFDLRHRKKIDSSVNPCNGCFACCRNMWMCLGDIERKKAYPDAITSSFYSKEYLSETCDDGVYVVNTGELTRDGMQYKEVVVINGDCIHLLNNGYCGVFGREKRPKACERFKFGSQDCLDKKLEERFVNDDTLKIVR